MESTAQHPQRLSGMGPKFKQRPGQGRRLNMKRKAISLALMGLVGSALALGSMTASAHEVVGFGVNVGVPAYAPAYPAYPAYPAPYYDPYYAAPYYYGGPYVGLGWYGGGYYGHGGYGHGGYGHGGYGHGGGHHP